jgi:membrane fusion protein (multidrug efflux system)
MKIAARILIVILIAAAAGAAGFWYGQHRAEAEKTPDESPTTQTAEEPQSVAQVVTTPAKIASISETLTAYGTVVAQPGQVRIIAVPFESSIVKTFAIPGQRVSAGADVVQVQASPDTLLNLQQAKNDLEAARHDLEQAQQRFTDRLATNQELLQAQQAQQTAALKLESLQQRGVGAAQNLKSTIAGVIGKLDVQEGQIVPAGNPLVEIAAENQIEIKIGVEPDMVDRLQVDQPVQIAPIGGQAPASVRGKVRMLTHVVNPDTRLTDVFVAIPPDVSLMIDRNVRCELTIASKETLIAPRQATLVESDGYSLFTVVNGHAVKHKIELGLSNDQAAELMNSDVKAGDQIVIVGNAELEDGMAVEEKQP